MHILYRLGSAEWLKTGLVASCYRHGNVRLDTVAMNSVLGWVNMAFCV